MRAHFLSVMEREHEVRPATPLKDAVGTGLAFHQPADPEQCGENAGGASRRPIRHGSRNDGENRFYLRNLFTMLETFR